MLPTPAKVSMRAQVDSMKAMMVERVSNADRARYALRASPNAHQRKDYTITISLLEKEGSSAMGQIRISLRPPSMLSDGMDLLTWRQLTKMIVATKQK
jgi:uncharacterized protein (DUF2252 family)